MLRYIVILALLMHALGHVLLVANAWGIWQTGTERSWFFSTALHLGQPIEGVIGLLWLVPLAGFLTGTWGLFTQQPGWQPMLLAAAAISTLLLIFWWGSINTSSAISALVFNLVVIVVLLWSQITATTVAGS